MSRYVDSDGRIFHHYTAWEDYKAGLFNNNRRDELKINQSVLILSDIEKCDKFFSSVTHIWSNSSEQNLSNKSINRQAWLGQAACCLSHGSNEEETKIAWSILTNEQRDRANQIADFYIFKFETEKMPSAKKIFRSGRFYRCPRTCEMDFR